jgi:hypothetical protein
MLFLLRIHLIVTAGGRHSSPQRYPYGCAFVTVPHQCFLAIALQYVTVAKKKVLCLKKGRYGDI